MSLTLGDNTKFQVPEDVVCRSNPDGTVVVMKMDSGDTFYKIDGVASEIWKSVEKGVEFGTIKNEVLNTYDVDEDQLLKDSQGFLEELLSKGLIELSEKS